MMYDAEIFVSNINYLTLHGYEPEITIHLTNNQSVFVIAYWDFVELTNEANVTTRFHQIQDILSVIDFENVIDIEGDIDFLLPVQSQSVVVDGKLWFNASSPKRTKERKRRRGL